MRSASYPAVIRSCTLIVLVLTAGTVAAEQVDFSHDIVPILRQHCIECHGGKEAKGSFSLNTRELLINSGNVDLAAPADSYLLELVKSDDHDLRMPPEDRPRLTAKQIASLERWLAAGTPWEAGFSFAPQAYEPPLLPRRPELPKAFDGRENPIDRILDHWLLEHDLPIPVEIEDGVFLRRVYLDLVGLLPEPEELQSFLADESSDKRSRMIRRLLDDQIAYADHWLSFYNDLLRNDYSGTGFITGGRKQISTWLYQSLLDNKRFDEFARDLIAPPTSASQGYIDGIKWRGEVSAGQTVEIQFAQSVAQSFLGINLKCASCHDSFIDRWKLDEAYGLAAIYSDRPLEIHRCDKPLGRTAQPAWLFSELGQIDAAAPRAERLRQLADLLTQPENGRFTRTIVNRLWYRLMGRGMVHPLDAMQTEPWNPELLDFLASYLSDHQYDVKRVIELIANSAAYQSRTEAVPDVLSTDYAYAGPRARRLTAEQFLDAVWQLTGAAPRSFDAPVFRALPHETESTDDSISAKWIWKTSASPPLAGDTAVFRKLLTLDSAPVRGGAVVTCDNEFVLYINGREIDQGGDWTQLHALALHDALRKGDNQIVVVARNAGSAPNPAGLFFAARLQLEEGDVLILNSDESWEWSDEIPSSREGRLGALPKKFQAAVVVKPVPAWSSKIDSLADRMLSTLAVQDKAMVRAALLKNNSLLRSLGRPTRDQIVSMRPAELTTLEAIDLANEAQLTKAFEQGAQRLVERFDGSGPRILEYVFQFALSRDPTMDELEVLSDWLGATASVEQVQDLLWSVCMLPEFWLVR